jgi:hypothetical protein
MAVGFYLYGGDRLRLVSGVVIFILLAETNHSRLRSVTGRA